MRDGLVAGRVVSYHTNVVNGGAQEAAPRAKRIAAGDDAPAFDLKDQNGGTHTLEGLLAKGKVALVFFRSGRRRPTGPCPSID